MKYLRNSYVILIGGGGFPLAYNRRWRFTATPSAVNLAMPLLITPTATPQAYSKPKLTTL